MLRNREIKIILLILSFAGIICTLVSFIFDPRAGYTSIIFFIIALVTIYSYLWYRNKKIRQLCDYLSRITAGDWSLDIRDNDEGELAILKSEIYKVTAALLRQSENLKRDKAFLSDSLSDISHQLKTPLTSISMMTDLLTNSNLPPDKRSEFLKNIRSGLDRVEWLVAALLKLARLDADAVEFQARPIRLHDLAKAAAGAFAIPMEVREQALSIEGSSEISISGDMGWLTEAVSNIIKNAVEHTPDGGAITIRLSENALYAQMEIQNTGRGIDKEDLPHIFERFYRGKNAGKDSVGIGLALSSGIVKHQNGTLEVTSSDKGSVFYLKFYKVL